MRRRAARLLLLLPLLAACGAGVGSADDTTLTVSVPLPPHVGNASGGYRPLILFRDHFFGRDFVRRDYAFEDCPSECEVSWNMSREAEATAVWFHSPWTSREHRLPDTRQYPQQYWVWAAIESPSNWHHTVNASAGLLPPSPKLDALFNLSMTFQRDSDVLLSYGAAEPLPPKAHASAARAVAAAHAKQAARWFTEKTKLAAWTVSHCHTASRREEYVARLRRHVAVDVFGKCADLWGKVMGLGYERHSKLLRHDYKMYLAFENRLCRDYITEKFWVDALLNGAIPIVRGGLSDADYADVAPPGSYINADWFDTPEALAAHMQEVGRNATLFASYHAWRATHRLTVDSAANWAHSKQAETAGACRLCQWLHFAAKEAEPPRRQLNLTRFWSGASSCRQPTDVPQQKLLFGRHPGQEGKLEWR